MILFIGRDWMEASPFNSLVKDWPARMPEISRVVVPLLPTSRISETVQTLAVNQNLRSIALNVYAHFAETGDGGETVCTFQKMCDPGSSLGKRAKHNCPVGDGFVSRYGYLSVK